MVRTIRLFAGIAFLATVALFVESVAVRTASAADDKKEDVKKEDKKKEDKKIEMPKLPEGSNPKWDFEAVEEKFTIVKGGINDNGQVYFLLELKEDMASIPPYNFVFTDSDGVKIYKTYTSCDPNKGKKEDRVRMAIIAADPSRKDIWVKAVKVKFSTD